MLPQGGGKNNSPKVLVGVKWSHFLSQYPEKMTTVEFCTVLLLTLAFLARCSHCNIRLYRQHKCATDIQ